MLVSLSKETGEGNDLLEIVRQNLDQVLHQVDPLLQLHLDHLAGPGDLKTCQVRTSSRQVRGGGVEAGVAVLGPG